MQFSAFAFLLPEEAELRDQDGMHGTANIQDLSIFKTMGEERRANSLNDLCSETWRRIVYES